MTFSSFLGLGIVLLDAGCAQSLLAAEDGLATTADDVEEYAKRKFANFNSQTGGKFTPLLGRISEVVYVREFVRRRDDYADFLLAAMEQAANGGDAEGIFLDALLFITTPKVVAETVVPEIEAGGRLEGFFKPGGKGGTVRRYIERHIPKRVVTAARPQPNPDFSVYAEYLRRGTRDQHPVLVAHIFRVDPRVALQTVMAVTDALREGINLQQLAHDEHLVYDLVWHYRNGFDIEPERQRNATDALKKLAAHDQWWVRLYIAETLRRYPDVATPQLVERLKQDEHDLVRQAILLEERTPDAADDVSEHDLEAKP